MILYVMYRNTAGWTVFEDGHEDDYDLFGSYLTYDAPHDAVLTCLKNTFQISEDDEVKFLKSVFL